MSIFGIRTLGFFVLLGCTCLRITQAEEPRPIAPAADGVYVLPTDAAKLQGKSVQRDTETGSLGKWSSKLDRANWQISTEKMGNYDVAVTWSVAEADAPQAYNIEINHHATIRAFTVSTSGEFKREIVGRIMLPPGVNDVTFFPAANPRNGLCKLKQIDIVPVADLATRASQEPIELHVPEGFEVEQVAGHPLTSHPMLACFDDRGRLFVAESTGVNADASVLSQSPPHEIRMLEDTNGDGKFDKSIVFADKMTIPQGVCWHDGSIYCSSPPNFWRLTDTDGDNIADKRDVLASGFPFRGMSDDMHGGTVGRDGRLYFASGRFQQQLRGLDGHLAYEGINPVIVRCRPDGSEFEMFSGAMGNCVGVDFSDAGDCFGSGTFGVTAPGKRDVLNHFVEGGAYPVLGQKIMNHKMTGGEMPPLAQFGMSASSDMMIYRDEAFGPEYRGNLFSAFFNMHKIVRHVLQPDGATYRCHNEDFLTSPSADFHPTDVLEDADGSLLVVDTGAWFLIGCPTSVIAKPQLSGGIYRIRRTGKKPIADPRCIKVNWDSLKPEALVPLLDDQRFAVRDRAMCVLASKRELALPALVAVLSESSPPRARLNAVWTLSRIDLPQAAEAARIALADPDESVRQASATTAGLFRDPVAVNDLVKLLNDKSAPVRREAATALGRIDNAEAVPALLASLAGVTDRFLEHAIIFALIRLDNREQTVAGLSASSPETRRGALIALDQMKHGELSQDDVTRALETDSPKVQQTALEVIARHPGWAKQIIALSRDWLADPDLSQDRRLALRGVLSALVKEKSVQQLIAQTLGSENAPQWTRLLLLEVIAQSELGTLPAAWQPPLLTTLRSNDLETARAAVSTIAQANQSLGDESMFGHAEVMELARDKERPADLRVAAAAAALRPLRPIDDNDFDLLADQCRGTVEPVTRLAAANAIGSAKLSDAQRDRVVKLVASAGPLELPALIRPFESGEIGPLGRPLIQSLEKAPGLSALAGDRLLKLIDRLPAEFRSSVGALLKRTSVDLQAQRQRLDELKDVLTGGDADRGRSLFFGNKATCSACHRLGDAGGNIGPNLAGVGDIRTRRDLLEAIVFPSASFARNFEPFTVNTSSGRSHGGIISRTTSDAIFLTTAERTTVRIPRSEIDDEGIVPSQISIMPQGLDRILQPDELRDLLAFLSSQREQK